MIGGAGRFRFPGGIDGIELGIPPTDRRAGFRIQSTTRANFRGGLDRLAETPLGRQGGGLVENRAVFSNLNLPDPFSDIFGGFLM